jgi:stage II sporulation protein D
MNARRIPILVLMVTIALLAGAGCPGKEGVLIKNMVTRFGKPPVISVYMHRDKQIKKMNIDEYLVGVVAGEMKPGWPLNAYAAQAIIARTFTMEFLSRGGTKQLHGTDISTDEKEAQAYNAANISPTIRKAVEMTKGLVLTYQNRYVKGWYSASCGGETALAKDGLAYKEAEPPYIQSVSCPEEKYTPPDQFYWQATLTSADVNRALQTMRMREIGTLTGMEILKRSAKGNRATRLKLVGNRGSATVEGADFRVAVGPEKMRSIWIASDIKKGNGYVALKGRGFGHGVGLCQWGAYAFAKQNKSPKAIVMHYYPKARVEKIW